MESLKKNWYTVGLAVVILAGAAVSLYSFGKGVSLWEELEREEAECVAKCLEKKQCRQFTAGVCACSGTCEAP